MNSIYADCIHVCNSLLRGEISAGETYGHVIDRFPETPVIKELRRIRAEHANSAALLSAKIREMGGEPQKSSGAWGMFTAAVQSAANLFGPDSALESLRQGESLGCKDYQDALIDPCLLPDCRRLIRDELLPDVTRHIADLERLESQV